MTTTATTTLHAQPYNMDAVGFYFVSAEDYNKKSEGLKDHYGNPVEEFEIQFIDGEGAELFNCLGINQSNLEVWFDKVEELTEHEKAALFYLCSQVGNTLEEALDKLEEVNLIEDTLRAAAEDLFDECYAESIPENLRSYIDYDRFSRDCEMGGDMSEFRYEGKVYTCTNAASI